MDSRINAHIAIATSHKLVAALAKKIQYRIQPAMIDSVFGAGPNHRFGVIRDTDVSPR